MRCTPSAESSFFEYGPPDLVFRVYLTAATDGTMGATRVYDLTACDPLDAVHWAERTAEETGELYSIALCLGATDAATLYWLVGTDGYDLPTEENEGPRRRMLGQRRDRQPHESNTPQ